MLTAAEIDHFVREGYVKIEGAFSEALAGRARDILWRDTGCDPSDPATWTKPVIRLGEYSDPPFREAVNNAVLHEAFDQLTGKDRWLPRYSLGTFPIRFPCEQVPDDTGWHAEASFYGKDGSMRLNLRSKGRALLMLFLFSEVGVEDAPTRILKGSHLDAPAILREAGEHGLDFMEFARRLKRSTLSRPQTLATGPPGTVYLCHPFLIHGAQAHRGMVPRFMAQPPLISREPLNLAREDNAYSPVEKAVVEALR